MAPNLNNLPPELLLCIIPHISYSPTAHFNLHLTTPTLHTLLQTHENSLAKSILNTQFHPSTGSLFPALPQTYAGLRTLHSRLTTLTALHTNWLHIVSHGPELSWLKGRWEAVHHAGLILLYRLLDAPTHADKVALFDALPASSLACLLFKLIASVRILRVYGPEPVNSRFQAQDLEARCEVELAVEEMLLMKGPELFVGLLREGDLVAQGDQSAEVGQRGREAGWATRVISQEIDSMEARQLDVEQPPTLICCLRRALAAKLDCDFTVVVERMWGLLSCTCFDEGKGKDGFLEKVVGGCAVGGGMKRIF